MPFDTLLPHTTETAPPPEASEVLCLLVSSRGSLYGIEAARVGEVHELPAIRKLPRAPRFVAGVINVRGEIVTVIDLAARLGQTPRPPRISDGLVLLHIETSKTETLQAETLQAEMSQLEMSQNPLPQIDSQPIESKTYEASQTQAPQFETSQSELRQTEQQLIQTQQIGLRVDEIRDIVSLPKSEIQAAPFGFEYSIVSGTTHWKGDIVLLLDVSQLSQSKGFDAPDDTHSEIVENTFFAENTVAENTTKSESATQIEDAEQAIFRVRAEHLALAPHTERKGAARDSDNDDSAIQKQQKPSAGNKSPTAIARITLGGEERGVILTQVREFCALDNFAPMPCCPPHILGQMNLRGEIVTLLDIAPQLGLTSRASELSGSQVVVVKVATAREESGLVGIVVEEVGDVLLLQDGEMRAHSASSHAADKLCGAVLHDDKWIPVLDLPALLSDAELVVNEMV